MKYMPLGIVPRKVWDEERLKQLDGAIGRYRENKLLIPVEWIQEQNELHRALTKKTSHQEIAKLMSRRRR